MKNTVKKSEVVKSEVVSGNDDALPVAQSEKKVPTCEELITERVKGIGTILRKQSCLFDALHGVNPESVQGMVSLALLVEKQESVSSMLLAVMDDMETIRKESVSFAKGDTCDGKGFLTIENKTAGKHDKKKRLVMVLDKKNWSHRNMRWFMRLHKAWIALNSEL